MAAIKVTLQSPGGSAEAVKPVSFSLYDSNFTVKEILDIWYGSDHTYYKLIADDEIHYIIRHDLEADLWELVQMDISHR